MTEKAAVAVAGAAHDINNFLTTVVCGSQLLDTLLSRGESPARALAMITEAARKASSLAAGMMQAARLRAAVVQAQRLDVNEFLVKWLPTLQEHMPAGIEVAMLRGETPLIAADPLQLERALLNLALNARDAMAPNRGALLFRTGTGKTGAATIEVTDTGHGMNRETCELIFEPFFSTKPGGANSGLGLAIVKELVDGAGGHIAVVSTPGVGTTFSICWPAACPQ